MWRYPKNAITQYESRSLEEAEKQKLLESTNLAAFLKDSQLLLVLK